jgi:hypothetical protein
MPDIPSGPAMRQIRGFGAEGVAAQIDTGLLLLYVLDPAESGWQDTDTTVPALAFGISFPGSNSGPKIDYKVDNVYWEQVYGAAD